MIRRLALSFLILAALPAQAATYRVDDSGTVAEGGVARLQWRTPVPGRQIDNTLVGRQRVDVRLNTAPWVGRHGRIFLVLPDQPAGPLRATWPAFGVFQAGEITNSQRRLVFEGVVTERAMTGVLFLAIEADATRLESIQQLNFHFEIDSQ